MTIPIHWKRTTYEETVEISPANGLIAAKTRTVTIDAWLDPTDDEIYVDAATLKRLDDIGRMQLSPQPQVLADPNRA